MPGTAARRSDHSPASRRRGTLDVFDQGKKFVLIEARVPKALAEAFNVFFAAGKGCNVDTFDQGNFTLVDAHVPRSTFKQILKLYAAFDG